jgi:S1-C subfamily serine protease
VKRLAPLVLAVLVVAGCSGDDDSTGSATTVTVQATTTASGEAPKASTVGSIADAVAEVLPSVVYVRTTMVGGGNGEGSGVVVDRGGIIVTNNHVVEGANEIEITFNDGRHRRPLVGTVIGTAAERDLAVVRVPARDLVPIRIARSSSLRLGDDVIAIGYPLGLGGPTVTSGIVSGLNRTVEPGDGPRLEGLLQTDAAINPGNSGGALVDRAGRLVGINTAAGRGDAAENIGFAIEIDAALPIIEEIRSEPEATRAWLGISISSVESDAAAVALGLDPSTRGVRLTDVFQGGPAARAELVPGDVIVALDGAPIRSAQSLTEAVAKLDPGDRIELEVIDTSGPRLVELTVTRRPR